MALPILNEIQIMFCEIGIRRLLLRIFNLLYQCIKKSVFYSKCLNQRWKIYMCKCNKWNIHWLHHSVASIFKSSVNNCLIISQFKMHVYFIISKPYKVMLFKCHSSFERHFQPLKNKGAASNQSLNCTQG